jgi:hypothetical protein
MVDLFAHFRMGYGALEYVQKHNLNISLPKRLVVVPLPPAEPGEAYYRESEDQPQQGNQEAVEANPLVGAGAPAPTAAPEQPKEPVAPTPSFGSAPPPRTPVQPDVPTPGLDKPVPEGDGAN